MLGALGGVAMPVFWQGVMLILIFSVRSGGCRHRAKWVRGRCLGPPRHYLGNRSTAGIARMTRSSMLEAIRQDYVRRPGAKASRNDWSFIVTPCATPSFPGDGDGLGVGALMAGAVITETIFAWPGIGRLAVDTISARDSRSYRA